VLPCRPVEPQSPREELLTVRSRYSRCSAPGSGTPTPPTARLRRPRPRNVDRIRRISVAGRGSRNVRPRPCGSHVLSCGVFHKRSAHRAPSAIPPFRDASSRIKSTMRESDRARRRSRSPSGASARTAKTAADPLSAAHTASRRTLLKSARVRFRRKAARAARRAATAAAALEEDGNPEGADRRCTSFTPRPRPAATRRRGGGTTAPAGAGAGGRPR